MSPKSPDQPTDTPAQGKVDRRRARTSQASGTVELALDKSLTVKAKVEETTHNLSSVNDRFKQTIEQGLEVLPATEVLENTTEVEAAMHECAADLEVVAQTLLQGVDELQSTTTALSASQSALAMTETALHASQQAEREASLKAMHDALTGLPNRSLFDDRLMQAVSAAERHGRGLAVLFVDLDLFKEVNDSHGHAAGDALLKTLAVRMTDCCRGEDTVCRYGGDEFLLLLIDPQSEENIGRMADSLLDCIARPVPFDNALLQVGASIGISVYPDDGADGEALVRRADAAMYIAKRSGRSWVFAEHLPPFIVPPPVIESLRPAR